MKAEKIFDKAQAHVMRNWKMYAAAGVLLLLWVNRDEVLKALGLVKPKPPIVDPNNDGANAANNNNTGRAGIKEPDGTITIKEFTYSQTVKNLSYDIWYWYTGWAVTSSTQAERCKIAKTILGMEDADIIEQNAHYQQTYKNSIYQDMMGVYNDPCSYWATESEYDAALKKLQNATKNMTSA
jgi:hypothetical protein